MAKAAALPAPLPLIQGRKPGSKNELYVALALDQLKLEYEYQVPIFGGRLRAGGQVVDFLVKRPPDLVPLYVQGLYWHRSARNTIDTLKLAQVSRIAGWAEPLQIWENECGSVAAAKKWIKENLL